MMEATENNERLIPALSPGDFFNQPEGTDRFLVRLWPDGMIYFKGSKQRIKEFRRLCKVAGLPRFVARYSVFRKEDVS